MNNFKKILLLVAVLFASFLVYADEVKFVASAQNRVIVGQPFQLVYSVNADGKNLRLPEIKGFEIIAGPYTSTSSSTQWINGKMTSSNEVRYTYTLLPEKEGDFAIPAATIVVKREKYYSNPLSIKVLPEDKSVDQQSQGQQSAGGVQTSQSISSDNLFIRPIVSRTKVMEQEAVILTYRLYSRVDVMDIQSPKFPDFKNFLVQEIELPQDRRMQPEHYQGVNYYTFDLRKVLLFPQHTGDIYIDPMSCDVVVRIRTQQQQVRSFFDDFFDTYQEVSKPISTSKIKIKVEPLPEPKPSDFSGAVGSFALHSQISDTEVDANQSITLKVKITGNGNLKMFKTPEIPFPADFESYEPKITNNISTTGNGMSGSKIIEYLVIPRHDGDFTIPSVSLSYFDTKSDSYKTLSTQPFTVNVRKGTSSVDSNQTVVANFQNQEKVALLASDIRYINTGKLVLKSPEVYFVGTMLFWLSYIVPFMISTLLIFFFRKKARENANVALMKNKKANKVARKRLKVAERQWKDGNKETFYDEILKALWGYLSDKLSMPVSELSRDNISSKLLDHSVSEDVITQFLQLLNDCEFERYAPISDKKSAMDKIFESTVNLISILENTIKK